MVTYNKLITIFAAMHRIRDYVKVNALPVNAMNVDEFAASKGISKQAVYNMYRRKGELDGFKIVVFKGFNFVVKKDYKDK